MCHNERVSGGNDTLNVWSSQISVLERRIRTMQTNEQELSRLRELRLLWVLVFDYETEDEAIYSVKLEDCRAADVVIAFQDLQDAEEYAQMLSYEQAHSFSLPSAHLVELEPLIASTEENGLQTAVLFSGLLHRKDGMRRLVSGDPISETSLATIVRMVPPTLFEEEYEALEVVWTLVHDAGTTDAQYATMTLDGYPSVVCFQHEDDAQRCLEQWYEQSSGLSIRRIFLDDLLETLDVAVDIDLCIFDTDGNGGDSPLCEPINTLSVSEESRSMPLELFDAKRPSSAAPAVARKMLESLYQDPANGPAAE